MPRGDGTGPLGLGPTGWGRGGCLGPRFGYGYGFGYGFRGRGFGFGPGWGMGAYWGPMAYGQPPVPDAELLEQRAGWLERQAAALRAMAAKAKGTEQQED